MPDPPQRSDYPAPYVVSDAMNGIHGLKSMADGRIYDSKRKYRAELRAHGCEEVGNEQRADTLRPFSDRTYVEDVREDVQQATEVLTSMSVTERANMVGAIERGEA